MMIYTIRWRLDRLSVQETVEAVGKAIDLASGHIVVAYCQQSGHPLPTSQAETEQLCHTEGRADDEQGEVVVFYGDQPIGAVKVIRGEGEITVEPVLAWEVAS